MISLPRQRALIELRRTGGKPIVPPAWFADGRYRISPDDGQPEKRCTKCREYLPAEDDFFARNFQKADDRNSWCKACIAEYQHQRHNKPENPACSP